MRLEGDSPGGRIKLLFVDDEAGYMEVLAKRMARRQIEVCPALTGSEAIQALRKQDFDVAVVDLKMEDLDGLEILEILKKMDLKLPVILLAGHGSEQSARDGLALGASHYLNKPCDLEGLLKKIRTAVQER